jgi:hypothetical protein
MASVIFCCNKSMIPVFSIYMCFQSLPSHVKVYLWTFRSHFNIFTVKSVFCNCIKSCLPTRFSWYDSFQPAVSTGNTLMSLVGTLKWKVCSKVADDYQFIQLSNLEYSYFILFHIWLNNAKGSGSKYLHTCMATSHVGAMGITWQFVFRDSECLCSPAGTRYIEMKKVMWQFVFQLNCLLQIETKIVDPQLTHSLPCFLLGI